MTEFCEMIAIIIFALANMLLVYFIVEGVNNTITYYINKKREEKKND